MDINRQFERLLKIIIERSITFPEAKPEDRGTNRAESGTQSYYSLNYNFLSALCGREEFQGSKFRALKNDSDWKKLVSFYETGLKFIGRELREQAQNNPAFLDDVQNLLDKFKKSGDVHSTDFYLNDLRKIFFPQGQNLDKQMERQKEVAKLRNKRIVTIDKLNEQPIREPLREILFTSNILATIPLQKQRLDQLPVSNKIKTRLSDIINEKQKYWYDHPIPLGIDPTKNEVLYGIDGLNKMIQFEKDAGNINQNEKLTILLSASTTHDGLHDIVKDYFKDEIEKADVSGNLDIYIFSESDTQALLNDVFTPLAHTFDPDKKGETLFSVFGVDGEYGRHYSFLKAITAFWHVFIDPHKRATFKIDLDQVFPQDKLLEQTGLTALDHFKTELWGAKGRDAFGNKIELAMIAGSLVNYTDIDKSLFYPDVQFQDSGPLSTEEIVFHSRLPQALSTEAEMMTRYDGPEIDGQHKALQRIHVTGGTNGILIDALRKFRPFTPTVIGRAEDQAYLLSVLFKDDVHLRYLHKAGLIMRHDKEAFAGEAIAAASAGKIIGDYVRMLLFSAYVKALPWPDKKIKEYIDPFTGCFVSDMPITLVYLRFSFKLLQLFEKGEDQFLIDFVTSGSQRLAEMIEQLQQPENPLPEQFESEKKAWDMYYDILDEAEVQIRNKDKFASSITAKALEIVKSCKVN